MDNDIGRMQMDLDLMNESDVREIIVRPLLHRLGYRQGTENNIRTEVTLRYGKTALGRRKKNDPVVEGRADYICEVISTGRWVVEVKGPNEPLDVKVVEQAHTYSAHPEIAADFFLVTNGRKFELYQTGVLDRAVLSFDHNDIEQNLLSLFNILGPAAVRERSKILSIDPGKPLGKNLPSIVVIKGGIIRYEEHAINTPLIPKEMIEGLELPVVAGRIERDDNGRIHAYIEIAKAAAMFRELQGSIGAADDYDFYSSDEYISDDPEKPTIFQNLYKSETKAGKMVTDPLGRRAPLPFGFNLTAFTEAVGYVENGRFQGTMRLDYDMALTSMPPMIRQLLEAQLGSRIPDHARFSGLGSFDITVGRE